jgi:hypothetical protein
VRPAELARWTVFLLVVSASAFALPDPLRERLATMPAPVQSSLRARAATWQAMTASQRQALRQRIATWDALPLDVRRERRESWLAWKALPADQRMQVRAAALAFAAEPAARQQALLVQFAQQDGSVQRGWLLGPTLGASFASLQPLLLQVPDGERKALLDALQALTPAERIDLGVLAQRTPPQQRDELRRALLSTAREQRAHWLQAQLAR